MDISWATAGTTENPSVTFVRDVSSERIYMKKKNSTKDAGNAYIVQSAVRHGACRSDLDTSAEQP
jgi:hypothetical protein